MRRRTISKEPAVRYRLTQYISALMYGRGDVILSRGGDRFHLGDDEAARLAEAIADYRHAISASDVPFPGADGIA